MARERSGAGDGKTELTQECQAFRGTLGSKVLVFKPGEPEHKGIVERARDYLETSFLPGRVFNGPAGFNTQLQGFFERANARRRRGLGCPWRTRSALSGTQMHFGGRRQRTAEMPAGPGIRGL